ncbi:MAG: two-component system, OmpR family, operon response regulator KdpE [Gaiellaceae bacterium]|nr:two-component system, OmpR family, operon response regulator KdpE [Gaiellaceae bacterium]
MDSFPPVSYREDAVRREPEWMTLGQAAKFLGVAQSTIRKWSDHGRIPTFYTPGGHRRYRRGDLEAFLTRSGPGRQQGGPPVLLVDDDAGMRELVRIQLEREGYSVLEAASAAEGLAAIEARKPELILLDVMMPHTDGWEMLRQIQERYGVGSIPVLMFSGQVDDAAQRQAASSGARGFVGKGFDLDQLVDQAKAILPL